MADHFIPTPAQQEAIDFIGGQAMVLAPPGCGKTDVLSRRIVKARKDYGVPYEQMLCLTFTNRASRNMQERVHRTLGEKPEGLFVGNVHRFCARFLIDNELVPPGTTLIDELDQDEIVKAVVPEFYSECRNWDVALPTFASWLWGSKKGFPNEINPMPFNLRKSYKGQNQFSVLANRYIEYKEKNRLLDFDDQLNHTYYHLTLPGYQRLKYSQYAWIEVDEVQDLNPVQIAIIEKLVAPDGTLVCFGSHHQSIFSFIGAQYDNISKLSKGKRIINFDTNFRSPRLLVNFLNSYATTNMVVKDKPKIDHMTSSATEDGEPIELYQGDEQFKEPEMIVSALVRQLSAFYPTDSVAVLGRTNKRLEDISDMLEAHRVSYMKLSRKDLFKKVDFKTVVSHLAVMADPQNWACWERLLYQSKAAKSMSQAVELTSALRNYKYTGEDLALGRVSLWDSTQQKAADKFASIYGQKYYAHTQGLLQRPTLTAQDLVTELDWAYREMVSDGWIKPIKRWGYVKSLLEKTLLINAEGAPANLLKQGVYEMRTYNEGDFYDNGIVQERVHLMTVHKAKGLQFDRVIVIDVNDYPSWFERSGGGSSESARVLYVAMSRARKQLTLVSGPLISPFLKPLLDQLEIIDRPKIDLILQIEKAFSPQDI